MTELSYKLKFDAMKEKEKQEKKLEKINKNLHEKKELLDSLSFFTKATNKLVISEKLLPMEKIMEKLNIVDMDKLKEEIKKLESEQHYAKDELRRKDNFKETLLKVLSSKFKRVFITYTPGRESSDYDSTVEMDAANYKEVLILETFWYASKCNYFSIEKVVLKDEYQASFESFFVKKPSYEEFGKKFDSLLADIVRFINGDISSSHYYSKNESERKYIMELTQFKLDKMKDAYADMTEEEYLEIAEDICDDINEYNKRIR